MIADDHAVLRESLAALLETQPDFYVQGKAKDGQEAVALVSKYHPDVLVLDLFMPNSDGFEVLGMLERSGGRVSSVILTGSENQTDYVQVVRLGARGLVLKGDDPERLFAAIRAVAAGEIAFDDEIAQQVLGAMAKKQPGERQAQPAAQAARARGAPARGALSARGRAQAVQGDAAAGGAGRLPGRDAVHERRPHP